MPGIIGIKSKDFAQLNSCNQTFISSVSIPNKACPYHDNEWENPPYVFLKAAMERFMQVFGLEVVFGSPSVNSEFSSSLDDAENISDWAASAVEWTFRQRFLDSL